VPHLRIGRIAEPQRVEDRDGARAHREDVAEDAADAGRRPWKGSMNDGMIVALDLEHDRPAVADVDAPAFSPGPWSTRGPLVRQARRKTRECL
jgi:hypothetical protein